MNLKKHIIVILTLSALMTGATAQQAPDNDPDVLQARLAKARAELAVADAALAAHLARGPVRPPVAAAAPVAPAFTPAPYPAAAPPAQEVAPDAPIPTVEVVALPTYDPLRLKVVMQFPANVKTIQQATQYMLETVNYKLTLSPLNPEESKRILSRPLMPQDRDGKLRTIEDGLLLISGDDTVVIVDRIHKLISFELQKKK
jgi:hypothetical protein